MNDTLDDDLLALSAIDPAGPLDPQAHRSEQARALLESITPPAATIPAAGELAERRRIRRWPILVGAAAAVTAVLVLTPNVLGGDAYASWTDVPAAASADDAQTAEKQCRQMWLDAAEPPAEGMPEVQVIEEADLVVAEQRGEFTYTVLATDAWAMDCPVQTHTRFGWGAGASAGSMQPLGDSGPLADDGIVDVSYGGFGGSRIDGLVLMFYARVGADVRAVIVHAPGAGDVEATVTNGYVAAWAPGLPEDAFDEPTIGVTLLLTDGREVELSPAEVVEMLFLGADDAG